jgi:hypothetical protein
MEQFLYKEECMKTEFTLAKKIHHTKQPAADRCRLPAAGCFAVGSDRQPMLVGSQGPKQPLAYCESKALKGMFCHLWLFRQVRSEQVHLFGDMLALEL